MTDLTLLVFAFVLSCIAASGWTPEPNRTRIIAAALAFFFAACIFGNSFVASHFK